MLRNGRFDHRTHIKDKKGNLTHRQPYRLRITKTRGAEYERPPGSGNLYSGNGLLISGPLKAEQDALQALSKEQAVEQEAKLVVIREAEAQKRVEMEKAHDLLVEERELSKMATDENKKLVAEIAAMRQKVAGASSGNTDKVKSKSA